MIAVTRAITALGEGLCFLVEDDPIKFFVVAWAISVFFGACS